MNWKPSLGAWPEDNGTRFRVWAPQKRTIEVVVEKPGGFAFPLTKSDDGTFNGFSSDVHPGDRYRYRMDSHGPFPDPVSRYQPEGVHGPSEVVDPSHFTWSDMDWHGVSREGLVLYELHVGTFTAAGTFDGVREKLPYLVDLGVNAIELLPLADFPGQRNWGYDGVALYAPARCYGRPDDLRRLVNEAHRHGLAVFLDVVYNHLGPDGNYLGAFCDYYFNRGRKNDWGISLNFDGPHSDMVRRFFIENALHWLHEYHMDGLRLDATHVIHDNSPRHLLAELSDTVHASLPERQILLIAEDHLNLATMYQPLTGGGWGLDGVWADDFHHQVRRFLTGDHEAYYRDFTGSMPDIAQTIRQGWFYTGQHSLHGNKSRGTDSSKLAPATFVVYVQNHDQVGNRALGERLNHVVDLPAYRAVSALLLSCPLTPMLFMGQEWATHSPFQFFTDHHQRLGKMVTEGRRQEFKHFTAFSDPKARERIPDPQALSTFQASRINWMEQDQEPHAATLHLYRTLVKLRRSEPALRYQNRDGFEVMALGETALLIQRWAPQGPALLILLQLRGGGQVDLRQVTLSRSPHHRHWEVVFTTEDVSFAPDAHPPRIDLAGTAPIVQFPRPAAVILRETGL